KFLSLSFALTLGLSGCQVFTKSPTWDKVTKVRAQTLETEDPSQAYANELHRVLADEAVEHKVVTYQYRYTTRLREEAIGTRTAIIYRDSHNGSYPWWLMDDRTGRPVWLPNGDVQQQVQFYAQHRTEIVDVKEFPNGAGSGKSVVGTEPALDQSLAMTGRQSRTVARTEKERRVDFLRGRSATVATTGAPSSSSAEERFRKVHGTAFDPSSATDRQKMAAFRAIASAQ
ncbi:MAG TPA: hypothetical protein VF614_16515, partial [Chthoniobacteraceae bacterium]